MLEDTFVPLALSEKLDLRNVPRRVGLFSWIKAIIFSTITQNAVTQMY